MKRIVLVLILLLALAIPVMAAEEEATNSVEFSGSFTVDVDFDLLGTPLAYGDELEVTALYDISESIGFEVTATLTDLIFEEPLGVGVGAILTFDMTDDLVGEVTVEYDVIGEAGTISFAILF